MIGTWVALLNKQEQEIMAEEEERIRKLGLQGAFDYGYSDKMNQQMLQELKNTASANIGEYASLIDNTPLNQGYVFPEIVIAKIRAENPKLAGLPIPPPKGIDEVVDMSGHIKWTFNDFINNLQVFPIGGSNGHKIAKNRLLNYPEFWMTFKLSFSQWVVPIIKYCESNNWKLVITSSIRSNDKNGNRLTEESWFPWLNIERYRMSDPKCSSDHNKGSAFDLQVRSKPEGKIPQKILTAILYKKLLLQQVPNTPSNKFVRQILLEFTPKVSQGWGENFGWVHIAAPRFENDKSVNYQFNIMGQGGGDGKGDNVPLGPTGRTGVLDNKESVLKVTGNFQKGIGHFFTNNQNFNWNSAPADKQWWMNKVRTT